MNFLIYFLLIFLVSCAHADKCQLKIEGEIIQKKRVNGVIKKNSFFAEVPNIMTPNSSSFHKIKINSEIKYVLLHFEGEKKSFERKVKVENGFLKDFSLKNFEEEIENHRPGILTIAPITELKKCSKIKIKFIKGD